MGKQTPERSLPDVPAAVARLRVDKLADGAVAPHVPEVLELHPTLPA